MHLSFSLSAYYAFNISLSTAYHIKRLSLKTDVKTKGIKMAIFRNQATITIGNTTTNSNVVTGEINNGLTLTKTALSEDYGVGDSITYAVSIVNSTATPYTGLQLTDNLGSFTLPGDVTVTPLDYIVGSLVVYVNGIPTVGPTAVAGPPLVISNIDIPANGNVLVVYEGRVNSYAPLAQGSVINNTASTQDDLSDNEAVPVREEVSLTIAKSVCPAVSTGQNLTYTFVIQNSGNIPVIATDGLIVSDLFDPILTGITVTIDGVEQTENVGYTYDPITGSFATTDGTLTVPAATYVTDPATGAITTTPGYTVITVTGSV